MSSYFENFPKVLYLFGDNEDAVLFQQLNKYTDVVDQNRDDVGTYIEYEIRDFERPDTLSSRLYQSPDYAWTFFIMNDNLREQGWPKTLQQVYDYAQNDLFPNYTAKLDISTADSAGQFADKYPVGQAVLVGTKTGTVIRKNLDVGEITISSDSDLTGQTTLTYNTGTNSVALTNTVYEYEGTHHYENDSAEWLDRFFTSETIVPKTNLDYLVSENESAKRIRIIKKDQIESVVASWKRTISK